VYKHSQSPCKIYIDSLSCKAPSSHWKLHLRIYFHILVIKVKAIHVILSLVYRFFFSIHFFSHVIFLLHLLTKQETYFGGKFVYSWSSSVTLTGTAMENQKFLSDFISIYVCGATSRRSRVPGAINKNNQLLVTTSYSLFSSHVVPLVEANSQMLHIYTYTYLVLDW
jgi:hypothetical protein